MNAQGDLIAVMQIVTALHINMQTGSKILGLPFAMMTLAGTCEMMYPT
jgi:hypothetical protein